MAQPSRCPICGYEGFDFTRSAGGQWLCPQCGENFGEAAPRGADTSTVTVPGICLAVVGGLTALAAIGWLGVNLAFTPDPVPPPGMDEVQQKSFYVGFYGVAIGLPVFSIIVGLIQLTGGIQMARLRTRGFVLFATILSLIPCSCGILLGGPIAIWSLIVLNKPEVQRMFR